MLVLSRKAGQTLLIGDAIRVSIIRISGNRVKLGVDGPRDIPVLRGELAFDAEDQLALGEGPSPLSTTS